MIYSGETVFVNRNFDSRQGDKHTIKVLFLGYLFCDEVATAFLCPLLETMRLPGSENVVFLGLGIAITAGKRLQTLLHSVYNLLYRRILQASVNRNMYAYDLERI